MPSKLKSDKLTNIISIPKGKRIVAKIPEVDYAKVRRVMDGIIIAIPHDEEEEKDRFWVIFVDYGYEMINFANSNRWGCQKLSIRDFKEFYAHFSPTFDFYLYDTIEDVCKVLLSDKGVLNV